MPSHRKSRKSAWSTARARALTLCATAAGIVTVPGVASAAVSSHAAAPAAGSVASVSVASTSVASTSVVSASVASTSVVEATSVAKAAVPTASTSTSVPAAKTYRVKSGDTLFHIAASTLGDGNRYPEIFRLNSGRTESDGSRFTNADLIQPGWTLELPNGSKAAPAARSSPKSSSSGTSSSKSSSSASHSSSTSSTNSAKKSSTSSPSTSSPSTAIVQSSGSYANNLDGWIKQAQSILSANGYPVSYNAIYQTAMHESAGNPGAANGWDSNAAAGTPSIGLMQTIRPTFNAYALPGHYNIYNPVDNIIAASRYAAAVYGSLDNVVSARCGGSCWYGY